MASATTPRVPPDLPAYPEHLRDEVERYLAGLRFTRDPAVAGLEEAMRYSLLAGGKRIRPVLALATAAAIGHQPATVLPLAAALEMIHTYSLIHDDLPAMDDDDLRRGRPTVHKAYDEATAVLVGDGLQSLAFAHLLAGAEPAAARLGRLLADNAYLMVEGQARDMAGEGQRLSEEEVTLLMSTKTGALLAAAVAGGAVAAGAAAEAVYPWGLKLGLAFQIADDLLDLTADTATLGKRAGKDAAAGKSTLPALLGIPEARRRAAALLDEALAALAPLGAQAEPLRGLARFVVARTR